MTLSDESLAIVTRVAYERMTALRILNEGELDIPEHMVVEASKDAAAALQCVALLVIVSKTEHRIKQLMDEYCPEVLNQWRHVLKVVRHCEHKRNNQEMNFKVDNVDQAEAILDALSKKGDKDGKS